MTTYVLSKSSRVDKKWMIRTPGGKTIHFGAQGYSDFTIHKDPERLKRYLSRHKGSEKWGRSGINTAGFWARWLLWNKSTLTASIKEIQQKFQIKIVRK